MASGKNQNGRTMPATLIAVAVAVGLFAAPENYTDIGRVLMRDALRPGLAGVNHSRDHALSAIREWMGNEQSASVNQSTATSDDDRQARRRLEIENATLHERIQRAGRIGIPPYRGTPSSPMLQADLIEARVLGEETSGLWRGGLLLNRGSQKAVAESDLVLQDESTLVAAGENDRLESGFAVFAGRTVLGRVRHVGHWSSSIEPVTATTFRGYAQLIRKTPNGHVFGATGVIKGTGKPFCRLDMIPVTEPVSVGDGVYTISDGGVFPYPMHYGKVRKAVHASGASHWEIEVEPAAATARPRTVLVLRRRLNPEQKPTESSDHGFPSLSRNRNTIRMPSGN